MTRLLIGYDDTAASRGALAYVAPLLADDTIELSLVTATSRATMQKRLYEEAVALLGREPVQHHAMTGSLTTALMEIAHREQPDLVVYGETERSWTSWAQFQRRSSLAATLPVSSLLVRGAARPIRRVLICAGGDASVLADAVFAGQFVRRVGARATILHVLSQMPLVFGTTSPRDSVVASFAATGAPEIKHMQGAVDLLAQMGIEAEIKIRVGLVVEEVAAELNEGGYDLLVIGAHRSQGLVERFLLEDVAANILGKNLGPVLVVRTTID